LELPRVGILPQVAPLARDEPVLDPDYVRRSMSSVLSSQHFRNELAIADVSVRRRFKSLAESSWHGLRIRDLRQEGKGDDAVYTLMVQSDDFVAEVGWMGHGLQMWLQTMWFLARSLRHHKTLILDEPDVYMHPDLQRRLVRLEPLQQKQLIITTHSVEIIAEVEAEHVLLVDKRTGKAEVCELGSGGPARCRRHRWRAQPATVPWARFPTFPSRAGVGGSYSRRHRSCLRTLSEKRSRSIVYWTQITTLRKRYGNERLKRRQTMNSGGELAGGKVSPDPDVGVEQQFQRVASQSRFLPMGDTMSPRIFPVPAIEPIQLFGRGGAEGGTTSATGCPKRVINTGFFARRTRSRTARQVALNSEMAMLSMSDPFRSKLPWSPTMVKTVRTCPDARGRS